MPEVQLESQQHSNMFLAKLLTVSCKPKILVTRMGAINIFKDVILLMTYMQYTNANAKNMSSLKSHITKMQYYVWKFLGLS